MEFAGHFLENPDEPVNFDGFLVFEAMKLPINNDCEVQIEVLRSRKKPKQYISIHSDSCKMRFVKDVCEYVHIPARAKPNPFVFAIEDVRPNAQLRIWSSWSEAGVIEHGIGNSGVIFEQVHHRLPGTTFLVRAASNEALPTFESVVFTVTRLHNP